MDRRIVLATVLVLVAVVLVGAVASNAYRMGLARGLAQSGQTPATPPTPGYGVPYGYYGPYWHPFGFGFFGLLFPLLFFFLIFGLLRGLFWGPRWGWHGPWKFGGGPQAFEEWHRRAHESGQEREQKA